MIAPRGAQRPLGEEPDARDEQLDLACIGVAVDVAAGDEHAAVASTVAEWPWRGNASAYTSVERVIGLNSSASASGVPSGPMPPTSRIEPSGSTDAVASARAVRSCAMTWLMAYATLSASIESSGTPSRAVSAEHDGHADRDGRGVPVARLGERRPLRDLVGPVVQHGEVERRWPASCCRRRAAAITSARPSGSVTSWWPIRPPGADRRWARTGAASPGTARRPAIGCVGCVLEAADDQQADVGQPGRLGALARAGVARDAAANVAAPGDEQLGAMRARRR